MTERPRFPDNIEVKTGTKMPDARPSAPSVPGERVPGTAGERPTSYTAEDRRGDDGQRSSAPTGVPPEQPAPPSARSRLGEPTVCRGCGTLLYGPAEHECSRVLEKATDQLLSPAPPPSAPVSPSVPTLNEFGRKVGWLINATERGDTGERERTADYLTTTFASVLSALSASEERAATADEQADSYAEKFLEAEERVRELEGERTGTHDDVLLIRRAFHKLHWLSLKQLADRLAALRPSGPTPTEEGSK